MSDDSSKDEDNKASGAKKKRRKWYLLGLAGLFVVIGVAYALYYFLVAQFYAETEDAYVQGNEVQVTPQISGTVTSLAVENTDHVRAGQVIATLDATPRRVALDSAEANLAQTVRRVRELFAQVAEQKAMIQQRESAAAQAHRDYVRDQKLVAAHGVTRQAFEQSRATYRESAAALDAARQKLDQLQAQVQGTTLRTNPQVKMAESQVATDYLALQRTKIIAPVSGQVAQRSAQVGEEVSPSKPILSIVPSQEVWVDANFKETALASMRIGQPATIVSDLYGSNVTYHGHVAGISAGTGAAFELLPPQNATGNWIKIVRRVPVRIEIDHNNALAHHPLRLGLSTEVTVNLHNTNGPLLAKNAPAQPRYVTHVYANRTAGVKQLIARIVDANAGSGDDAGEQKGTSGATSSPKAHTHRHATGGSAATHA